MSAAAVASAPPKRKQLGNLSHAAEYNLMSATEDLDEEDETRETPMFIKVVDLSLATSQNEIAKLNFPVAARHLDKAERKLTGAAQNVEVEIQRMLSKQYAGDEQQCRVRLLALTNRRWRVLREHRAAMEARQQLAPLIQSSRPVPMSLWFQDFGLASPSQMCPTDSNLYLSAKLVCVQCGVDTLSPSSQEQHIVTSILQQQQGTLAAPKISSLESSEPRHMLVMLGNNIVGYACWQSVEKERTILLRCVALTPRYRKRGFGKLVMERMVTAAQNVAKTHGQLIPHAVVAVLPNVLAERQLIADKLGTYGFVHMAVDAAEALVRNVEEGGSAIGGSLTEQVRVGQLVCFGMSLPVDDSAVIAVAGGRMA